MAKEKMKKAVAETFQVTRKVNNRKYPDCKAPRPDNYSMRKSEAEERRIAWEALSTKEKLAKLDARLGIGIGAVKQRAKLQHELEKVSPPAPIAPVATIASVEAEVNAERRPPRVRAKERRSIERSKFERDVE